MDLMTVMPRKMGAVGKVMVSKYLKDTRLKAHHLMIITGIGRHEGVSQKELVECLPFDKSYISTGVRELMEFGYVFNDAEGKVHNLILTDSGKEIMAMTDMMFDMIEGMMFDCISDEERRALTSILAKIDKRSDEILERFSEKNNS